MCLGGGPCGARGRRDGRTGAWHRGRRRRRGGGRVVEAGAGLCEGLGVGGVGVGVERGGELGASDEKS